MAEGTIRAQVKKAKGATKVSKGANVPNDGREKMDRDLVKAVLASPLITPWPNIPNHLQKSIMAALPKLVPAEVAEYHVSRARCHQKVKKHNRKILKRKAADGDEVTEPASGENIVNEEESNRPVPPPILQHLVLGINETVKQLERSIEDLKIRLQIMSDALNDIHSVPLPSTGLLPTAPRTPSPEIPESAFLGWVIVPLLSVSPQSLVNPIPQYCATYNAHVRQWDQLSKAVKTRLKQDKWSILGEEREEIRVVPLGDVEMEMARTVGLRRLACMGVRMSHPDVRLLSDLLPKSVLHPPRYNITLPFPKSRLKVVADKSKEKADEIPKKKVKSSLPIPHVHYAPLTVKGITTTVPIDGSAKKQKRLLEVRQKRLEDKEKRRALRKEEYRRGIKGEKGPIARHGAKKAAKGRKRAG